MATPSCVSHNRRKEDLPPASLETQRHRAAFAKVTALKEFKCGVYFAHVGTHGQNKRHGFLKEYIEGPSAKLRAGEELSIIPPLSHGIAPRNRGGIFNSGTPELQMPPHSLFTFRPSLCLRVSSGAGGESSLEFGDTRFMSKEISIESLLLQCHNFFEKVWLEEMNS